MLSEKSFAATTEGLKLCREFLESLCANPRPQIIMDEIVSNIVRCSGATAFTVRCEHVTPGGIVTMTFADDGKPFDPTTETSEPDITAEVEDRQIGGLGIFMVKKMAKTLEYRREGSNNILTVTM